MRDWLGPKICTFMSLPYFWMDPFYPALFATTVKQIDLACGKGQFTCVVCRNITIVDPLKFWRAAEVICMPGQDGCDLGRVAFELKGSGADHRGLDVIPQFLGRLLRDDVTTGGVGEHSHKGWHTFGERDGNGRVIHGFDTGDRRKRRGKARSLWIARRVKGIDHISRGHCTVPMMKFDIVAQLARPDQAVFATLDRSCQIRFNLGGVHRAGWKTCQPIEDIIEQGAIPTAARQMRVKLVRICAKSADIHNALRHRLARQHDARHPGKQAGFH